MAKILAMLVVGSALSSAIPGNAVAPVGSANASIAPFHIVLPEASQPVDTGLWSKRGPPDLGQERSDLVTARSDAPLRFGKRVVSRRIVDPIVRAASATGVDPIYLMALADKESSFRPDIRTPTSSAEGLFQFIDRTWLETVRRFGSRHGLDMEADAIEVVAERPLVTDEDMKARILDLRRDPYVSAVMAAEMLKQDAADIGLRLGRVLNPTELYLAHFLGLEGAARFLSIRDVKKALSAAKAFPAAARANVSIFYATGRRSRRGLSVSEVYSRVQLMIDSRIERFKDVRAYSGAEVSAISSRTVSADDQM